MKLARATFLGIRGLTDRTIELTDRESNRPADVVLVTGGPGSGKTRLLEALVAAKEAIAPFGPPVSARAWVRPDSGAAKVSMQFVLDADEQNWSGLGERVDAEALFDERGVNYEADEAFAALLDRYEHDPKSAKLDYLPASRALPSAGAAGGLGASEQRVLRPLREARKFAFVPRFLMGIAHDEAQKGRFTSVLSAICPSLRYAPDPSDILQCFSSRGGPTCSAQQLSSSEIDAILIAASAALIRYDRAIVLLDRPELGAGDSRIAAWVTNLSSALLGTQLILASSSATLAQSGVAGSVVDLGE